LTEGQYKYRNRYFGIQAFFFMVERNRDLRESLIKALLTGESFRKPPTNPLMNLCEKSDGFEKIKF